MCVSVCGCGWWCIINQWLVLPGLLLLGTVNVIHYGNETISEII